MHVGKHNDRVRLTLNPLECQLLVPVLRSLLEHYRIKPGDMDAGSASAWYSTRGCESGRMTEEETRDWMETLHQQRLTLVPRLKGWIKQLTTDKEEKAHLEFTQEDAEKFLGILNDHRLWMAAKQDIGQLEMDLRSFDALNALPTERQYAIYEIEFLGWMIEHLLRVIAPEAAHWHADQEQAD